MKREKERTKTKQDRPQGLLAVMAFDPLQGAPRDSDSARFYFRVRARVRVRVRVRAGVGVKDEGEDED